MISLKPRFLHKRKWAFLLKLPPVHFRAQAAGGDQVALAHVVLHHAMGAEPRRECGDRFDHHLDPVPRQAVGVAVVVERDHFVAERVDEVVRVAGVGDFVIDVLPAVADREAVLAVVGLGPPAIEDRKVEPAVEHGLHAAGARRLPSGAAAC